MSFFYVIILAIIVVVCITAKEGDFGCLGVVLGGALFFGLMYAVIKVIAIFEFPQFVNGLIFLIVAFLSIFGAGYVINQFLSSGTSVEEDIEAAMKRHGYNVSKEMIHKLATHPRSPAIHPAHKSVIQRRLEIPQIDWYDWLCEERTREIHYLSFEDLGKELGVPLEKIPVDKNLSFGDPILEKKILAMDYILRREGLKYRNDAMDSKEDRIKRPYLYDSSPDGYAAFFSNFVDNYLSDSDQ